MKTSYFDLIQAITLPVDWWDEHGVPRYENFHPSMVDPYASEVALTEIECQACGCAYHVSIVGHAQGALSNDIHGIEYGDPPNTGCCSSGPTMNAESRKVLQFWTRGQHTNYEWNRVPELEVDIPRNPFDPIPGETKPRVQKHLFRFLDAFYNNVRNHPDWCWIQHHPQFLTAIQSEWEREMEGMIYLHEVASLCAQGWGHLSLCAQTSKEAMGAASLHGNGWVFRWSEIALRNFLAPAMQPLSEQIDFKLEMRLLKRGRFHFDRVENQFVVRKERRALGRAGSWPEAVSLALKHHNLKDLETH